MSDKCNFFTKSLENSAVSCWFKFQFTAGRAHAQMYSGSRIIAGADIYQVEGKNDSITVKDFQPSPTFTMASPQGQVKVISLSIEVKVILSSILGQGHRLHKTSPAVKTTGINREQPVWFWGEGMICRGTARGAVIGSDLRCDHQGRCDRGMIDGVTTRGAVIGKCFAV